MPFSQKWGSCFDLFAFLSPICFFIVILWFSQNPNVGEGTCPILGRHKQSSVWLSIQKSYSCCLFCTHNLKLPYLWQLAKKDEFPNHEPTEKRQNKKNSALTTHCSLAFLFGFHFWFLHLLWIVIADHKCCLLSLGGLHKSRASMATKLTRLPQNCPTIHLWSGVFHNFNCNKNIGHALTLTWSYGFRNHNISDKNNKKYHRRWRWLFQSKNLFADFGLL